MTKRILTGILSVLLLAGSGVCGATEGDPFPLNKGSAFEYFQDNIPDIFFFPAAKARWNGDKVTAKQWPMLTDHQKTMFISECAREVEKRSGREITIDGWKYIIALNGFAEEACRDVCLPQPMTQVLGDLLAEAEKA